MLDFFFWNATEKCCGFVIFKGIKILLMKQIFTWMVAVAVCASCTRENIGDVPRDKSPSETGNLLGKKLENPYSLGNMRRALANLSPAPVRVWVRLIFRLHIIM